MNQFLSEDASWRIMIMNYNFTHKYFTDGKWITF